MQNMTSEQVCASSVHVVCYVMHEQGMSKSIWIKVCKTNMYNHGNPQCLVLIGIQNNTKMSFEHFIKHLVCTNKTNM